jgi:8-oxo-dGTP diphosphatase
VSRAARAPAFPCARCGRPIRRRPAPRSAGPQAPPRLSCPRCRFLIYDYPRLAAGVLVVRDGTVLMLRRAAEPRRGCLDIPGGFMDAGETIDGAARRELREETGLTVGALRPLGWYWDRYFLRGFGWFPTLNVYSLGRWRSGTPVAADDAASAEWVPIARLGRTGARLAWRHMPDVFRALRRALGRR